MAKVYSVVGQSNTKPTGLPKGLTVKEEDRAKGGTATSLYGTIFTVTDYSSLCDGETVSVDIKSKPNYRGVTEIDTNKLFSFEEARNLRDALNDVLGDGEPYQLRTITDDSGDNWYEVSPDNFVFNDSRHAAESRWKAGGSRTDCGRSWADVNRIYGVRSTKIS